MQAEIQSQASRPVAIPVPLQIQVGTGEGRFQQELSEILAGPGCGRRLRAPLAEGLNGLGKKFVHTLEAPAQDLLPYQPFQLGLSDFDRHSQRAYPALLHLGYLVIAAYAHVHRSEEAVPQAFGNARNGCSQLFRS
jgi:hypothetical protein